jgi:hypothetical protein
LVLPAVLVSVLLPHLKSLHNGVFLYLGFLLVVCGALASYFPCNFYYLVRASVAQRVGILYLGLCKGRVSRAAEVPLCHLLLVAASCRGIVVLAGHVLPVRLASKLSFSLIILF